jgi:hypothetical protein
VHPRNHRCLPPGQNPLEGEPKPLNFLRIREYARKKHCCGALLECPVSVVSVPIFSVGFASALSQCNQCFYAPVGH